MRGADGQVVANANVGLRLTLLQGSDSGPAVWTSTQTLTTNANGLLTAVVGDGNASLDSIDWSQGPYYLRSEVDPAGGSNYELVAVQQLLSVPYALRAATVENHTLADAAEQGNAVQSQIKQLADPTDDMDAVNLRTLNAALQLMQQRMDSIMTGNSGGGTTPVDTVSGGEWVDLGLPSGLLWATHNVGATSPEDYGNYYAWGETSTKSIYMWNSYAYGNSDNQLTKYCNYADVGFNGFTDTLTILQPGDDAATVNMGNGARTPTYAEWQELITYTTYMWTTHNGVSGCTFTATNGNSIFLPTAGDRWNDELLNAGSFGVYWSSSISADYPHGCVWYFYLSLNGHYMSSAGSRFYGLPVRAVRQN